MQGLKCPHCQTDLRAGNMKRISHGIQRPRFCPNCDYQSYTLELTEERLAEIVNNAVSEHVTDSRAMEVFVCDINEAVRRISELNVNNPKPNGENGIIPMGLKLSRKSIGKSVVHNLKASHNCEVKVEPKHVDQN